jgi:hypothetical protein
LRVGRGPMPLLRRGGRRLVTVAERLVWLREEQWLLSGVTSTVNLRCCHLRLQISTLAPIPYTNHFLKGGDVNAPRRCQTVTTSLDSDVLGYSALSYTPSTKKATPSKLRCAKLRYAVGKKKKERWSRYV